MSHKCSFLPIITFTKPPNALPRHLVRPYYKFHVHTRSIASKNLTNSRAELKIGVSAAIFRKARVYGGQNDVLLVRRGKEPNYGLWALPGGALKEGELLLEAVLREVEEETGVNSKVLNMIKCPVEEVDVAAGKWKLYVFAGVCAPEEVVPVAGDDAMDSVFCPVKQLGDLNTVEGLERVIKTAQGRLIEEPGLL